MAGGLYCRGFERILADIAQKRRELLVNYGGKPVNEAVANVNHDPPTSYKLKRHSYFGSMATAGYSGTPLLKKLGIKPGIIIRLINAPANYFELLEADISDQLCTKNESPDLIHLFAKNYKTFESTMKELQPLVSKNPAIVIWVSWYKKTALRQAQGKLSTDVTEDAIRNYALKNNLVDVKVCAVSEIWSGLKLVVPLVKRTTIHRI